MTTWLIIMLAFAAALTAIVLEEYFGKHRLIWIVFYVLFIALLCLIVICVHHPPFK